MKAKVDQEKCSGYGICEQTCPEVFKVEGGKSQVKVNDVPADVEEKCREAVDDCPTGAISAES